MKKRDLISGSVLLSFAALLFWQTRELPVWGPFGPSSGFFPMGLSLLLAILSATIMIRAWLQTQETSGWTRILGPEKKKYFLYLLSFFIFSLIFAQAGYTFTLVGFLIFILRFVERQSWKITVGIALTVALVSNLLFVRFLSVPLPEGFLAPFLRPM